MRDVRTFDSTHPDAAQRPSMDVGRAFQGGQEPKIPQQPWGTGWLGVANSGATAIIQRLSWPPALTEGPQLTSLPR